MAVKVFCDVCGVDVTDTSDVPVQVAFTLDVKDKVSFHVCAKHREEFRNIVDNLRYTAEEQTEDGKNSTGHVNS